MRFDSAILLVMWPVLVTACVLPPKTTKEFREISVSRKGQHVTQVKAPLSVVVSRIEQHAKDCLNFNTSTFMRRDAEYKTESRYNNRQFTRWENRGSDHPTFLVMDEGTHDINRQEGGFFMFLVDVESIGSAAKATMYDFNYPSGYYDWATELGPVIAGEKSTCQLKRAQEKDFPTSTTR